MVKSISDMPNYKENQAAARKLTIRLLSKVDRKNLTDKDRFMQILLVCGGLMKFLYNRNSEQTVLSMLEFLELNITDKAEQKQAAASQAAVVPGKDQSQDVRRSAA